MWKTIFLDHEKMSRHLHPDLEFNQYGNQDYFFDGHFYYIITILLDSMSFVSLFRLTL